MSVVDLDDMRPHFNVIALCLQCQNRWIGTVLARTSLFKLECPNCKAFNSFAAFLPLEYLETLVGDVGNGNMELDFDKANVCERCELHEKEEQPHTCPYKEELNNDSETLCNCCQYCQDNCRWDV